MENGHSPRKVSRKIFLLSKPWRMNREQWTVENDHSTTAGKFSVKLKGGLWRHLRLNNAVLSPETRVYWQIIPLVAKSNQKITRALRALGDFLITFLATRGIIANIHSSPVKEPYIVCKKSRKKLSKTLENSSPLQNSTVSEGKYLP